MKRAIVVDVEGTTSSIAFVKDTLFPHARRALPAFVRARGSEPEVRRWLDAAAADLGPGASDDAIVEALRGWIDADRKHTALKALQGLIWREGYESGAYLAHLYDDAAARLREWRDAGYGLYVYSSGSVEAQKLFFAHSITGDLTPLIDGHFDTVTGAKRDADSYRRIAGVIGLPPERIAFLSDVVEELDAAREAGLRTFLVDRREDYPQPREGAATHGHARVESFADIDLNVIAADSA